MALSQNLETIHAFPLLAAVPDRELVTPGNHSAAQGSTAAVGAVPRLSDDIRRPTEEALIVLAEETLAIPIKETVDSLVRPLVESVEPIAPVEPAPQSPAPQPAAVQPEEQPREAVVELQPVVEIEPVVEREPVVDLDSVVEALVLQSETRLELISAALEMERAAICAAREMEEAALRAALAIEQAGIRAIVRSFETVPAFALLPSPAQDVKAPAPPVFEWLRTPRPSVTPRIPGALALTSIVITPQAVTLAGACLPPQLRNFAEALERADERNRKPFGFPALVVSVGVAMSLFLATGTLLQYLNNRHETAAAASQAAAEAETPKPSMPGVAVTDQAVARSLEISGLRLVSGFSSKAQVQFLVVNHSPRDLRDTAIQVAVRSSEALADSQPIMTINASIHSLGPYQSKEVRADLGPDVSPSALSDWQSLRAEILTVRPE